MALQTLAVSSEDRPAKTMKIVFTRNLCNQLSRLLIGRLAKGLPLTLLGSGKVVRFVPANVSSWESSVDGAIIHISKDVAAHMANTLSACPPTCVVGELAGLTFEPINTEATK